MSSWIGDWGQSFFEKFAGAKSGGATPVPIPNTEVKSSSVHGTDRATDWESRPVLAYIRGA